MKTLILILLLLWLPGCKSQPESFDRKFLALHSLNSQETGLFAIRQGKSRDEVLKSLGPPLRKRGDTAPAGPSPSWGPQEGLESLIGLGAPYEEWLYRDGGYDYYVWFATRTGQPQSQWVVMAVAKYPTGAVF